MKLSLASAVGIGVGLTVGLTGVPLAVLILQLATPVGVTSYLMAERYKTDPDAAASLVVTSTVLAIVALPITLSFLLPG